MLLGGAGVVLLAAAVVVIANQPGVPLATKDESTLHIQWLPETVKRWEDVLIEMGQKYNIDPAALAILMTMESGGYPQAHSEADARGLMQVTPVTAEDIASRYLKVPQKEYDLFDPRTNIEFAAAYLAMLRDEFGEPQHSPSWNATVELIAAGYNGGPSAAGALYRGEGVKSDQTLIYSRDALNMWREKSSKESLTYNRWLERGGQRLIDLARGE